MLNNEDICDNTFPRKEEKEFVQKEYGVDDKLPMIKWDENEDEDEDNEDIVYDELPSFCPSCSHFTCVHLGNTKSM